MKGHIPGAIALSEVQQIATRRADQYLEALDWQIDKALTTDEKNALIGVKNELQGRVHGVFVHSITDQYVEALNNKSNLSAIAIGNYVNLANKSEVQGNQLIKSITR